MIRPQHRPLQAVTKHEAPGSSPARKMGRAAPGYSAPRRRQRAPGHTVCGTAAFTGRGGYRTGSFPSTDVAQGQGKDRIGQFCDFLLRAKFGFALWEVRRINLAKGKR